MGLLCFGMGGSGILPGAKGGPRSRSRRALPAAPASSDKKTLLTFDEKELRAVLLEEYEWQRPMVRDLLNRLKRRKESKT